MLSQTWEKALHFDTCKTQPAPPVEDIVKFGGPLSIIDCNIYAHLQIHVYNN